MDLWIIVPRLHHVSPHVKGLNSISHLTHSKRFLNPELSHFYFYFFSSGHRKKLPRNIAQNLPFLKSTLEVFLSVPSGIVAYFHFSFYCYWIFYQLFVRTLFNKFYLMLWLFLLFRWPEATCAGWSWPFPEYSSTTKWALKKCQRLVTTSPVGCFLQILQFCQISRKKFFAS